MLFIRMVIFPLVFLLGAFAYPVNIAHASVVTGCDSLSQRRLEVQFENFDFTVPGHTFPNSIDIRITANIEYEFCLDNLNKIKPKNIRWCWTVAERSVWFDGVRFNAYIFDDNETVNPSEFTLRNPLNDWQRCGTQDIALEKEKWLEMSHSPGYTAQGDIIRIGMFDAAWRFHTSNPNDVKYFHPSDDPATTPFR